MEGTPGAGAAGSDGRSRAGGGVPRPWAILAVLLGLMALVAALSASTSDRVPPTGVADHHPSSGSAGGTPLHGTEPSDPRHPVTTSTTAPNGPTTGGEEPTAANQGQVDGPTRTTATATATAASLPTSTTPADVTTLPTTTTTTTTALPPVSVVSLVPGGAPPVAVATPYPGPGNIAYPTVSASYPAGTGTTVTVRVTWAGGFTLSLGATCPGTASESRTGSSPLVVSIDAARSGTCTVTLEVASASWGPASSVSYTLSITPPVSR